MLETSRVDYLETKSLIAIILARMLNLTEMRQEVCWRNPRFIFLSIVSAKNNHAICIGQSVIWSREAAIVGVMNRRNASPFLHLLWWVARRGIRFFISLGDYWTCLQIDCIWHLKSRHIVAGVYSLELTVIHRRADVKIILIPMCSINSSQNSIPLSGLISFRSSIDANNKLLTPCVSAALFNYSIRSHKVEIGIAR